jgi:hypothetical protein
MLVEEPFAVATKKGQNGVGGGFDLVAEPAFKECEFVSSSE